MKWVFSKSGYIIRNRINFPVFLLKMICGAVFLAFCTVSGQKNINFSVLEKKNDKLIEKFRKKYDIPGLSISVSYRNQLIYSKGSGYADVESKKEIIPSKTKFRIGSISKTMTSVALAKLQEQGKLNLHESVYKYLDSLPVKEYDITVEQLLSHRAGLVREQQKGFLCGKNDLHRSNFYPSFQETVLESKPGTAYRYSNYGYILLGVLIEKLAGKSLVAAKKELVLDKAGLEHTVPDTGNFDGDTSTFYYRNDAGLKKVPCTDCSFNYGPGCYLSTSEDLVKLGNSYLYADRILAKETFKDLLIPRNEEKTYALGFMTGRDFYRNYFFGHGGAYPGGMADLRIYPKERLVISALINIKEDDIRMNHLLDEIIFQYLELIKKEG
ncbi:serine hydrolase domain-containing protein [Chryseobacterium sp.]|uniref:serine hydrolase domain-containing protein n=1 Tax=Chryseobacterium sp. TaxID=1871047 RepID=UPI002852AE8E|nr:serine hydrolase domain-containing protein [Chryseobacterium sp.]